METEDPTYKLPSVLGSGQIDRKKTSFANEGLGR